MGRLTCKFIVCDEICSSLCSNARNAQIERGSELSWRRVDPDRVDADKKVVPPRFAVRRD